MIGPSGFMAAPKEQPSDCKTCKGSGIATVDVGEWLPRVCLCPACNGAGRDQPKQGVERDGQWNRAAGIPDWQWSQMTGRPAHERPKEPPRDFVSAIIAAKKSQS
jgi:hypothetical protein